MGMAASQVRLLQLTSRKNTIGYQLQNLSLQKTALSRDMQRVTRNYQEALNTKTLKWSNNAGVSYVDLSYANLMRPGSANKNNPYLITNGDGKVVLDSKYQQYAEMISPDGKAGGDWESNRTQILASLTGISSEKIDAAFASNAALDAAAEKVNSLQEEGDKLKEPVNNDTAVQFFKRAGNVTVNTIPYNIGSLYNSASTWTNLGNASTASSTLTNILNGIANNMKNYLTDEDYKSFTDACNTTMTECNKYFTRTDEATKDGLEAGAAGIKKDGDNFTINLKAILDNLMGSYERASVKAGQDSYGDTSMGTRVYYTRDKNSVEWQNWKASHDAWQAEYDAAVEEYNAAVDSDNQALTSEEESNINFYEKLFTAIAEKGWVANSQIEDNDYLNNMLQNNQYYITTMEEQTDSDGKSYFEYSQDIASNFENVFSVNDTDAQNEALIDYEYEKSVINEKETRIDTRMQNLETEQSAINEMIKGIETVRNDNTERTFGIFA